MPDITWQILPLQLYSLCCKCKGHGCKGHDLIGIQGSYTTQKCKLLPCYCMPYDDNGCDQRNYWKNGVS